MFVAAMRALMSLSSRRLQLMSDPKYQVSQCAHESDNAVCYFEVLGLIKFVVYIVVTLDVVVIGFF